MKILISDHADTLKQRGLDCEVQLLRRAFPVVDR